MKHKEVPMPITIPVDMNKPATFLVLNPLDISPNAMRKHPIIPQFLAPSFWITRALTTARIEMQVAVKDPTNDNVDGGARPSRTNLDWRTPK
jgi:hypothetical protein